MFFALFVFINVILIRCRWCKALPWGDRLRVYRAVHPASKVPRQPALPCSGLVMSCILRAGINFVLKDQFKKIVLEIKIKKKFRLQAEPFSLMSNWLNFPCIENCFFPPKVNKFLLCPISGSFCPASWFKLHLVVGQEIMPQTWPINSRRRTWRQKVTSFSPETAIGSENSCWRTQVQNLQKK